MENPTRILRLGEVRRKTGLKSYKIFQLIKRGYFHPSILPNSQGFGLYESEIKYWQKMNKRLFNLKKYSGILCCPYTIYWKWINNFILKD